MINNPEKINNLIKKLNQIPDEVWLEAIKEVEEESMEEVDEIEEAKNWLAALEVNSEFEASSKEYILSHIENQDEIIDEMADMISSLDFTINKVAFGGQARFGSTEEVKQYFERKVNDFK